MRVHDEDEGTYETPFVQTLVKVVKKNSDNMDVVHMMQLVSVVSILQRLTTMEEPIQVLCLHYLPTSPVWRLNT